MGDLPFLDQVSTVNAVASGRLEWEITRRYRVTVLTRSKRRSNEVCHKTVILLAAVWQKKGRPRRAAPTKTLTILNSIVDYSIRTRSLRLRPNASG